MPTMRLLRDRDISPRSRRSGPPVSSAYMATSRQQTCHGWRTGLLEHAIQPSINIRIRSAKMQLTRAHLDAMDLAAHAGIGAFASFSSVATLHSLPPASERMVFLSMVSARRKRLDPSSSLRPFIVYRDIITKAVGSSKAYRKRSLVRCALQQ